MLISKVNIMKGMFEEDWNGNKCRKDWKGKRPQVRSFVNGITVPSGSGNGVLAEFTSYVS